MGMFGKSTQNLLKLFTGLMQNNYPENLGKSYIVNSPLLFKGAWAIVKNFLDEKTVAKVSVHSNGQKSLLEAIDEDQLIEYLGGKNMAQLSDNVGPW